MSFFSSGFSGFADQLGDFAGDIAGDLAGDFFGGGGGSRGGAGRGGYKYVFSNQCIYSFTVIVLPENVQVANPLISVPRIPVNPGS